jgi:hypothetical protein
MTVFVERDPESGRVVFHARAESPGVLGDLLHEIGPGESAFGKTYAEWQASDVTKFDPAEPPVTPARP